MNTLDYATSYIRRGWSLVPLHHMVDADTCSCGNRCEPKSRGKHPSRGHRWDQKLLTSAADIHAWWGDGGVSPQDGVGIATGKTSGIWVLDMDGPAGLATLTALLTEHGPLPPTHTVRTGSGGLHHYFRHPDDFTVHGSTSRIGQGIDVRGWHGQVVAPPSTSWRGPYETISDTTVADAPQWLIDWLRKHAATVEQTTDTVAGEPVELAMLPDTVKQMLQVRLVDGEGRHGHFHGLVAACQERGYTQGQTVTIVAPWCDMVGKFGGRVETEVARSWGKLQRIRDGELEWVVSASGTAALKAEPIIGDTIGDDHDIPAGDTTDDPPPSWSPISLESILDGTWEPERPTGMPRTDSAHLLYPGRVHSFHGESESGKSMLAQAETARRLNAGEPVLYLDWESDQGAVVNRLLELGAEPSRIRAGLDYVRPESNPYNLAEDREAFAQLLRHHYGLAVLDGVTEALVTYGAGSLDNDEITGWIRRVPRLVAQRTGAAVVMVDHVTKSSDNRGRFAIGGQAKLAALDGAAYSIEVVNALGRGMRGTLSMRIAKDRPGAIRPHSGPFRQSDRTQEAARVVIDSTGVGIDVTVEPPDGAEAPEKRWRPTHLMQEVSLFLEATDGATVNMILDGVTGKKSNKVAALNELIECGWASYEDGPRNSKRHHIEVPYREGDEAPDPAVQDPKPPLGPTGSPLGPGPSEATGSRPALPVGGRTQSSVPTDPPSSDEHQDPVTDPDEAPGRTPCVSCGTQVLDGFAEQSDGHCMSCARHHGIHIGGRP